MFPFLKQLLFTFLEEEFMNLKYPAVCSQNYPQYLLPELFS